MLEDQLLLCARLENQGKLIETLDAAQQFGSVHKINRDRRLFSPGEIEETVLYVLRR